MLGLHMWKKTFENSKNFATSKTNVLLILFLSFSADTRKNFVSRYASHTYGELKKCWTGAIVALCWNRREDFTFLPEQTTFLSTDSSQTKIKPFFQRIVMCWWHCANTWVHINAKICLIPLSFSLFFYSLYCRLFLAYYRFTFRFCILNKRRHCSK